MPKLSTEERLILVDHVNSLMKPDFEKLMSALDVPKGVIPSGSNAQGNCAIALLKWVKGPMGCGLIEFLKVLDVIAPVPFDVSLDSKLISISPSNQSFHESLPNGIELDMIFIPEGQFCMGSSEGEKYRQDGEGPQHSVKVPTFYMGKYPVTQAQWYAVSVLDDIEISLNPVPSGFRGVNRPVEQINWYEANEFCKRLSKHTGRQYRLPSEAEWEYACRARTTTAYYFGDSITEKLVSFRRSFEEGTTPVGNNPPNAFGLYDMHGNVWEWCQDVRHDSYDGAPTDGRAWVTGGNDIFRVIRGGSWINVPENCRSAYRSVYTSDDRDNSFGFRVVCNTPRT